MFRRPHARIWIHKHTQDGFNYTMCMRLGRRCIKAVSHLHSGELNHRPDALRNHVEVLCSFWGNQGKIGLTHLHTQRKIYEVAVGKNIFIIFFHIFSCFLSKGACSWLLLGHTLSLRISSAATRASPALWPFWMTGYHRSLGVWSMPGFNFTSGEKTLRPSSSSFPWGHNVS